MKEKVLTVTEAARGFSDLVNRVHYRKESAILTRNGRPVARIVPVNAEEATFADLARKWKPGKFLTPKQADDFARDIEKGRKFFKPYVSPWE